MSRDEPTILIVDDDADICRNLSDILTDLGYRVETALDGLSALELVRGRPFDVALLDLKMPGMDGLTLYRKIRELNAGTVAVLVTAYAGGGAAEEAIDAGAWRVVAKPVDFRALLGLVEEALGQPIVLVVDDDRDLCDNLWDLLRDRGFRVCLAHDAPEAAERLNGRPFDVVLIDMRLPTGDGGAVFRMVRDANPGAHTVLITAHRPEVDREVERVLREGADAVCYKPFDLRLLLAELERLTAGRRGEAAGGEG